MCFHIHQQISIILVTHFSNVKVQIERIKDVIYNTYVLYLEVTKICYIKYICALLRSYEKLVHLNNWCVNKNVTVTAMRSLNYSVFKPI